MDRSTRKYHVIFIFSLFFLPTFFLHADTDQQLFVRGNRCYAEKKYVEALAHYEAIQAKGPAVFFNMGNSYCCKGDYSQALMYWQRAERGASYKEFLSIAHNKELILKKMGKAVSDNVFTAINKHVMAMVCPHSLYVLQVIILLVWYIFVIVYFRAKRRLYKQMFFIVVLFLSYGVLIKYTSSSVARGIVIKQAPIFVGPNKNFHTITSLACADGVEIKEKKEGWYKIRYTDAIGWVEADAIEVI